MTFFAKFPLNVQLIFNNLINYRQKNEVHTTQIKKENTFWMKLHNKIYVRETEHKHWKKLSSDEFMKIRNKHLLNETAIYVKRN